MTAKPPPEPECRRLCHRRSVKTSTGRTRAARGKSLPGVILCTFPLKLTEDLLHGLELAPRVLRARFGQDLLVDPEPAALELRPDLPHLLQDPAQLPGAGDRGAPSLVPLDGRPEAFEHTQLVVEQAEA